MFWDVPDQKQGRQDFKNACHGVTNDTCCDNFVMHFKNILEILCFMWTNYLWYYLCLFRLEKEYNALKSKEQEDQVELRVSEF